MALLFGAVTCGIRFIGGADAYEVWLFRNNVKSGDLIQHHDNGEVASIIPYADGKSNGLGRFFDEDGVLTETVSFKRGKRSGPYTAFHPNGAVKESVEFFDSSRLEHTFRTFDEQGRPLKGSRDGR